MADIKAMQQQITTQLNSTKLTLPDGKIMAAGELIQKMGIPKEKASFGVLGMNESCSTGDCGIMIGYADPNSSLGGFSAATAKAMLDKGVIDGGKLDAAAMQAIRNVKK